MRIYLDICSLQRPLDDRSQLRVNVEAEAVLGILALCGFGKAELLHSDALEFETERNPNPVRRDYVEDTLANATDFIIVTTAVEHRAQVYGNRGIKPLDAWHLASAVEGGADYFCTCDDKLLKRARQVDTGGTRPVSPLELIEEVER